jgi:small-conductance mechanosensitive channel
MALLWRLHHFPIFTYYLYLLFRCWVQLEKVSDERGSGMGIDEITAQIEALVNAEGGTNGLLLVLVESLVAILIVGLLNYLFTLLINRQVDNVDRRHQLRVYSRTFMTVLGVALLMGLWFPNARTVLSVVALLAAALTVTLSRPITNVLAWLVIVTRAPVRVGDRIEVNGVKGDVIDIGMLHTHLLELANWVDADQSTGRIVHVPNTYVFDGPIFNATDQFELIWNELDFFVTLESDWETGRTLLLELALPFYDSIEQHAMEAAERMARRYAYQRGISTPFVYVKLLRDGIKLSLRYLCEPRRRRGTAHDITVAFLTRIRDYPAIQLAAPGYRITAVDS